MRLYLDSSALVKLVQKEAESDGLQRLLRRRRTDQRVTCALARVEVVRAVVTGGPSAVEQARRQLARLDQITLSNELLDRAATLATGMRLRNLDAIHLAAAQVVGTELRAVITYDQRMVEAAESLGLVCESPD